MSEWKNIDSWWKAILIIGILASIGATVFPIEFLSRKHLFGLGLGMILIGISNWIAQRHLSSFTNGGFLSWTEIKHNLFTGILLLLGILLVLLFGFLIIKSLI
jgi:hypothetical protein